MLQRNPELPSEEPARSEAELFRNALASAGLGVFEVDAASATLRLDALCRTMLSVGAERLELKEFLECVHEDDRDRLHHWVAELATRSPSKLDLREELRCVARKGASSRRIELRGRLMLDVAGKVTSLAGTMRDCSEQRQVELERDERIAELERTVLFSEMFVGILAHDLRNPLAGIVMSAQLAGRNPSPASLSRLLSGILASSDRIARMIAQLLDFTCARGGAGIPLHLGPSNLMTVANAVLGELQIAHPEWQLAIEAVGDTLGNWDSDRIAQILSNLVGNAIQHGELQHGVRVSVDGSEPDEVVVQVNNQGLIPPDLASVLFHPFRPAHQNRNRARGFGLGLYISRQIAVAHGGDVDVTSQTPEGTTFRVRLPRKPESPRLSLPTSPQEAIALARLGGAPATAVTAQLFGVVSLDQRAPRAYYKLLERYGALLDALVESRVFKPHPEQPLDSSGELRAIAERFGELNAGAREVAELHARAIRARTTDVPAVKALAVVAEGRLTAFELMGHLLSYYRRRAGFRGAGGGTE